MAEFYCIAYVLCHLCLLNGEYPITYFLTAYYGNLSTSSLQLNGHFDVVLSDLRISTRNWDLVQYENNSVNNITGENRYIEREGRVSQFLHNV